jgi:hypothetical protein
MTTPNGWHADATTLARYAADELDFVAAASVEAHLLACADCRAALVPAAGPRLDVGRLDRVWDDVVDAIDAPRAGVVERALRRLGVGDGTARLLAMTPSLHVSWLAGVGLALLFAVIAASSGARGMMFFLTVAPLLPVAGVAVAYGPRTDPTHELQAAAPHDQFRLVLLRTAAVLATTVPLVAVGALLTGRTGWVAAAWLLPALGLTAASLALGDYLDPLLAAVGITLGWVAVVVSAFVSSGRDPLAAFRLGGQLGCAAVLAASLVVLVVRHRPALVVSRRIS